MICGSTSILTIDIRLCIMQYIYVSGVHWSSLSC